MAEERAGFMSSLLDDSESLPVFLLFSFIQQECSWFHRYSAVLLLFVGIPSFHVQPSVELRLISAMTSGEQCCVTVAR